jgi:hypothetical protein
VRLVLYGAGAVMLSDELADALGCTAKACCDFFNAALLTHIPIASFLSCNVILGFLRTFSSTSCKIWR